MYYSFNNKKKRDLSGYVKDREGIDISLIYIIHDEIDLSFLVNLKNDLSKIIFIIFDKNKSIINEALSFNPSLIILSNNDINKDFSIMEKILKL